MNRRMIVLGLALVLGCVSMGPWQGSDISGTWHVVALSEHDNPGWATVMTIAEHGEKVVGSNSTGGSVSGQRVRDEVYLKVVHHKDGTTYTLQGLMDQKMKGRLLRGNWRIEGGDSGTWTASRSFGWKQ